MVTVSSGFAYVDARAPLHAQTAAIATAAVRVFVAGACYPCGRMRDWSRREFLQLAGMAAAGASLPAAGCGSRPAADPPGEGRLTSPAASSAGAAIETEAIEESGMPMLPVPTWICTVEPFTARILTSCVLPSLRTKRSCAKAFSPRPKSRRMQKTNAKRRCREEKLYLSFIFSKQMLSNSFPEINRNP